MKKLLSLILLLSFNIKAQHSKFNVTVNSPGSDELLNLSFSAVYNLPDDIKATEEQAINVVKQYVKTELSASPVFNAGSESLDNKKENPAAVIFIKVKKLRQRIVINNNALFDADLVFIYSSIFKSAAEIKKMIANHEIEPYMKIRPVNPALADVNIWDISQVAALLTRNN